jgi:hypothetical protein
MDPDMSISQSHLEQIQYKYEILRPCLDEKGVDYGRQLKPLFMDEEDIVCLQNDEYFLMKTPWW